MNLTQTINYTNPADFTFDAAKIVVSGGQAKLKQGAHPLFTANTASSAGYTFDPAKIEFVGSVIRQIQQSEPNITAISPSGVTLANNGAPNNTITKTGGVNGAYDAGAISSNQLASGDGEVSFQADTGSTFVAGLATTHPNYSYQSIRHGFDLTATGLLYIIELGVDIGQFGTYVNTDVLEVSIEAGVVIYRKNNTLIYTSLLAPAYPAFFSTSMASTNAVVRNITMTGTDDFLGSTVVFPAFTYTGFNSITAFTSAVITDANAPHYTLNSLWNTGGSWVASNGTYAQSNTAAQVAAAITTLPLSNTVTVRMITQTGLVQMQVSALTINYTAPLYSLDNPSIKTITADFTTSALISFTAQTDIAGSDAVHFQLIIAGVAKWWTGSAWATSDGTYTQSNDAATLNTNLASLTFTPGALIELTALLHSFDGSTSPDIVSASIVYVFHPASPTAPAICRVQVFLEDILGVPLSAAINSASFHALLDHSFVSGSWIVARTTRSADFDSAGYAELDLVTSDAAGINYKFSITYNDGTLARKILFASTTVPNQANAMIGDIASIVSG